MSKKTVENKTGQTISTLIDDLKSEDIRKRLVSVQNLNVIASVLGPERTRLELIPFLNELMEDEDEILSAIADSLSNFVDFVGGNQNVVVLFNVLEQLCKSDESTVRNKASATLIQLIKVIDIKKNEELLSSLVKRLNETESLFARGPLSQIIPSFYNGVSSAFQQDLNKIYLSFSRDSIPSIKKQASMNLKDFIAVASPKNDDVVMNIINTFMQDEQDFVRLYVVDACTKYLKIEGTQKNQSQVQQYLKSLSEDKSWRIKYYLCDKLGDVAAALGKGDFKKLIFGSYISYLEDEEPELRSVAVSKATIVGAYLDQDDIINKILPIVKTLASDPQSYVRNSVATGFLGLSQIIGKKNTVDIILPVLLQLLKDADSEVRISLFKSLNQITNVLGIDTLSQSIVPALSELAQDKNWRIRASSIDIISFFAKELGQEFLTDKILKILMDWLSDKVYAVREAAVSSVKNVIQSLGWAWSEKNIMPKIISLKDQANYLQRETLLFLIIDILTSKQASKQINAEYINKTLIPTLTTLSKDPIANIRFNVSKCFKILAPSIKDKDSVKKILNALCEDPDFDVKYYAKQALDSM